MSGDKPDDSGGLKCKRCQKISENKYNFRCFSFLFLSIVLNLKISKCL